MPQHSVPGSSAEPALQPVASQVLDDLARQCEQAGYAQQGDCLMAAVDVVAAAWHLTQPDAVGEMIERARDCTLAAAWESAALALLPGNAVVTAGRLADGSTVAQVILPCGTGAHSRSARWIGMAILAALLRALARKAGAQEAAS